LAKKAYIFDTYRKCFILLGLHGTQMYTRTNASPDKVIQYLKKPAGAQAGRDGIFILAIQTPKPFSCR
jgi:hypothetical protein